MSTAIANLLSIHPDAHPRAKVAAHSAGREAEHQPIFEPNLPAAPASPCDVDPSSEGAILRILERPRDFSVDSERDFGNREVALRAIIDGLAPVADLALARRLAAARPTNPIVKALARMNPARRGRIAGYVADSRRRAMKAAARR